MTALISALALTASLLAPPALPPERDAQAQPESESEAEAPADTDAPSPPTLPPDTDAAGPAPGGRTSLPPGLQPVPFPLEQRRAPPPTSDGSGEPGALAPSPAPPEAPPPRRSIVDLRDPFNRPPPRARGPRQGDASRLLMPDLKDPFAPGVRRVRSKKLDMYVPNDIRDPFRDRPRADGPRAPCVKTTADGTVVQTPGKGKVEEECRAGPVDLRDPFTR